MKIAVVGGCGSGKTTIANVLQARGYDAYVVGQEHSEIQHLWKRQDPDFLVFLDVALDTVRQRRGDAWPEWLYRKQQTRLAQATAMADVRLSTDEFSVQETVEYILKHLPPNT